MTRVFASPDLVTARGTKRRGRPVRMATVAVLGFAALVGFLGQRDPRRAEQPVAQPAPRPATRPVQAAPSAAPSWWLDPRPSTEAAGFSRGRPSETALAWAPPAVVAGAVTEPVAVARAVTPLPRPAAAAMPVRLAAVPLPVPRPADLAPARMAEDAPRPERRTVRRATVVPPSTPVEEPGFLEKFFGLEPTPRPALAYAALEAPALPRGPLGRLDPAPAARAGTAVYDITARTVTLPSGERLEAHSGLGDKMDDPRHVHVRMRGATPPGTYDLTERERLFHGVRAIRLSPVGGAAAIHGRDGILAHTYMLGPRGDSNGCVSFRDYDRFLQAFLRGEVTRLVVVAGGFPNLAEGLFSRGRRG